MKNLLKISVPTVLLAALLFAGCNTGGGGGDATTYTVTYDANGADSGSVPTDSNNYKQGQTVTVQGNTGNLVKTGCMCCGWNTVSDGSGDTCIEGGTFEMESADVTLYAEWMMMPGCPHTFTAGGISFIMAYVPGGITFPSDDGAGGPNFDDSTATVTDAYWIAETEVTYELWYAVHSWAIHVDRGANVYIFANPGREGHDGPITDPAGAPPTGAKNEPVTEINWRDAMAWCNALTEYYNDQNGTGLECVYYTDIWYTTPIRSVDDTGSVDYPNPGSQDDPYVKSGAKGFRLPTLNEWELAARYIDDANDDGDIQDLDEYYPGNYASGATADYNNAAASGAVAWYSGNSGGSTHVVATKTANALGLSDMSGNVWELCFDWHTVGYSRVVRGGSWLQVANYLQVGELSCLVPPYIEHGIFGFRPARTP